MVQGNMEPRKEILISEGYHSTSIFTNAAPSPRIFSKNVEAMTRQALDMKSWPKSLFTKVV